MPRNPIKINTAPVASNYATGGERIIEYSSPAGSGLISFRIMDDGTLRVELYRHDASVQINVGKGE